MLCQRRLEEDSEEDPEEDLDEDLAKTPKIWRNPNLISNCVFSSSVWMKNRALVYESSQFGLWNMLKF